MPTAHTVGQRLHGILAVLLVMLAGIVPTVGTCVVAAAPDTEGDHLIAVYQARPVDGQSVATDTLSLLRDIIARRLSLYGIGDATVQTQGSDQITVAVPRTDDAARILTGLGQVGLCEFVGSDHPVPEGSMIATTLGGPEAVGLNADGTPRDPSAAAPAGTASSVYQTILTGDDIINAAIDRSRTGGFGPVILLTLNSAAAQTLGNYTSTHLGRYMSVVVDKSVLSSATIRSRIDTSAAFEGLDEDGARALVVILQSGRLPVPIVLTDTHAA